MTQNNFLTKTLNDTVMTRRSFLKWSAAIGGTAALAGGVDFGLKTIEGAVAAGEEQTLTVGCYHNCGGRCILATKVKDGTILRIVPDPTPAADETPEVPRAIPCVRGRSQIRRVYAPDRLKYPMKRVGKRGEGKFERISWEEALDTIANEMKRIKDAYGNEAFYFNYAWGVTWNGPDGSSIIQRLLSMFGGYVGYYGTYSEAAYGVAMPYITGGYAGNSADDVVNSKLVLLLGDNSLVTRAGGDNGGYWYMKAAQNGTKFIVVDPIMTETVAATQAEWIPINPGTDVALIAAMAYVMVKENLYDKEFMDTHTAGFDESTLPEGAPRNSSYMAYLMGKGYDKVEKTPEWAAAITGIPAERIANLAREIASIKPCAIIQCWGPQRRAYGEQFVRAVPILAAMTGNFGIPGGNTGQLPGGGYCPMGGIPVPPNPVQVSIPCFMWPDFVTRGTEMTVEKDYIRGASTGWSANAGDTTTTQENKNLRLKSNMKFMWNHGGNCIINQHADVNYTRKVLEDDSKLEFIVTVEVGNTPSTMYSDIVLPGTTGFEVDNIITGEGHGIKGNHAWALFNHKVIEPMFEAKDDVWIAEQLADRLGFGDKFRDGHLTREDWLREMVAGAQASVPNFPSLEEFKQKGFFKLPGGKPFVAFEAFRADPEANPLGTATGKIEIYSPVLANLKNDEIPPIPTYIPEWEGVSDPLREKYPLMMMTTHFVARSHSTFENVDILREAHPQCLWINTLDAEERGIKNGDMVKVYNDRGVVHIPAYVTNRIRPGTTNMPQGAHFTPNADGVDIRGCGNTLTNYRPTPMAKGFTAHTNLVQVEKL